MSRLALMSLLSKIAGVAIARRSLRNSAPMVQQLLVGVAVLAALAVVLALLVFALLAGLAYALYHCLIASGSAPAVAALQIAGGVIVLIGILVCVIRARIETLRGLPASLISLPSPISRAQGVYAAFMDGLSPEKPDAPR